MNSLVRNLTLLLCLTITHLNWAQGQSAGKGNSDYTQSYWELVNDSAEWQSRAGLQAVQLEDRIYVLGGRSPLPPDSLMIPGSSHIWSDVWESEDFGLTWQSVKMDDSSSWPARAYFQAVTKSGRMFVLGGQNFRVEPNMDSVGPPFVPESDFFNDVWSSKDGENWTLETASAPWHGRAGLSAVNFKGHIYVIAGSYNDDPAIVSGPPTRVYLNDVWKSKDGETWELVTANAPWEPRAGAQVVVKNGRLWLIGGEQGFLCDSTTANCPPYFNDVWVSKDGENWDLVTPEAPWQARPGHHCVEWKNLFVLWGGFGLSQDSLDPFKPSNPADVWTSKDGAMWSKVSDAPWNSPDSADVKYDFDALVISNHPGESPMIYTFGGDRETFDFLDSTNHLKVDSDIWRFDLFKDHGKEDTLQMADSAQITIEDYGPNPFDDQIAIHYTLLDSAQVMVYIFNMKGELKGAFDLGIQPSGSNEFIWDGTDGNGVPLPKGPYLVNLHSGGDNVTVKVVLK